MLGVVSQLYFLISLHLEPFDYPYKQAAFYQLDKSLSFGNFVSIHVKNM